ncbi:hypothetical protein ILYODFUR_027509 [Ilyodon furcidens]|uniref:Uncharacterized protein n=1 Tax=Ilyodon furcidens TaxID=33524 RepID=A0ABV0SPQ9_9TELE
MALPQQKQMLNPFKCSGVSDSSCQQCQAERVGHRFSSPAVEDAWKTLKEKKERLFSNYPLFPCSLYLPLRVSCQSHPLGEISWIPEHSALIRSVSMQEENTYG